MAIIILLFPLVGGIDFIRTKLLYWIPNVDFWHSYMSYIGAILAVITALFIVKWEDITKNKKSINTQWKHSIFYNRSEIQWVPNNKTKEDGKFNYIVLKFSNNGNKAIIITNVHLVLSEKRTVILSSQYFADTTFQATDIKLPCKLDIDEYAHLHIPLDWFCDALLPSIEEEKCVASDKIVIAVIDATDVVFKTKIDISYGFYLQCYEKYKFEIKKGI